ncbi:MAG: polysaccharide pyruvyl transferase family protein [Bifidobacteriaceae bacterium]|nr:polysaccharide pyruvyl transferase family protein [Bifidobacteriaceae bacterium]MEE0940921.1 polysaccharide pyruvyl transferase family protein [Bifidobacteriaceae bacterium]
MKKILLITQGHTPNIGDYAIARCEEEFFKSQGFEVVRAPYEIQISEKLRLTGKLAILTNKIFSKCYFLNDIWHKKRIKSLLANADCNPEDFSCAIIGGGELVGSHKGFNSSFYNWCKVLSDKRIPIAVHGVSGDINMNARLLERYKVSLRKCFRVSVRDRKTVANFKKAYDFVPFYSPDAVFAFPKLSAFADRSEGKSGNLSDINGTCGTDSADGTAGNESRAKNVLCIPVPYAQDMEKTLGTRNEQAYFDYLINAACKNSTDGNSNRSQPFEIRLNITSTVAGDMDFVQRFADYAQNTAKNKARNNAQNIPKLTAKVIPFAQFDEFLTLLESSDLIISARMHACILALLKNRKICAVPFREKLKTFKEEHTDSQNTENLRKIIDESYAGLCALADEIQTENIRTKE